MKEEMTRHIAKLCRLRFSDYDLLKYTEEFTKILDFFSALESKDTKNIKPLTVPLFKEALLREDVVEKFNSDELIQLAPERSANLIKVPTVI